MNPSVVSTDQSLQKESSFLNLSKNPSQAELSDEHSLFRHRADDPVLLADLYPLRLAVMAAAAAAVYGALPLRKRRAGIAEAGASESSGRARPDGP